MPKKKSLSETDRLFFHICTAVPNRVIPLVLDDSRTEGTYWQQAHACPVYLAAMASISTRAPLGRSFTAKAARAGLFSEKYSA